MSFSKTVLKNTFWVSSGQVVNLVFNFLWVAIVARYIGPSLYGIYGYGYSLCAMSILLVNFGFDQLMILRVTTDQNQTFPLLKKILKLKLSALPIYFLIIIGIGFFRHEGGNWWQVVSLVSAIVSLDAISYSFVAIFQSHQLMEYDVILQVIGAAFELAGAYYGIHHGFPFHLLLLFNVIASLFRLGSLSALVSKKLAVFSQRTAEEPPRFWAIWREALPLFLLSIVSILYSNLLILICGWLNRSPEELGVFVAATRLQSYILMLPATLTTVLLPAFSNLYAQSRSEFLVKFNGVVKLLYWISIPLSLMFSINAGGIVRFVYGSKFLNAAPLLSILALILMSGSSYAFGSTMLIIGKRYLSLALYGITTVFIAAFSLVFIPRWGVEAACWAQFGGAALGIVIYPAYLYRFFSINFPFLYLAKVIGATIAMAVLDRSLLAWNFPFILAGAIAWGGLIAVSYLLGIFKGSEWSVVKHLVDKFYAFIKRPPTLQGI